MNERVKGERKKDDQWMDGVEKVPEEDEEGLRVLLLGLIHEVVVGKVFDQGNRYHVREGRVPLNVRHCIRLAVLHLRIRLELLGWCGCVVWLRGVVWFGVVWLCGMVWCGVV